MYVTEDTTRADPDTLRALYSTAIRAGARRVCIADTVGHATPAGAASVVRFVKSVVDECGGDVGIDWHGHRDRDFAVANTLSALEAGATRLHGTALGIGERVGNTPMDLLLVNLVLMGALERDLSALCEYCDAVSAATGVPIPANYPVVGHDAFRTATGVHAAAVIKAFRKTGSRTDRRGVLGGAREPGRAGTGDRHRSDVGKVECRLLARAPGDSGQRSPDRPDLREGQSVSDGAHRQRDPRRDRPRLAVLGSPRSTRKERREGRGPQRIEKKGPRTTQTTRTTDRKWAADDAEDADDGSKMGRGRRRGRGHGSKRARETRTAAD